MSVAPLSIPVGLAGGGTSPLSKGDDASRMSEAATQFEALLIEQMLKTSREAGGGGWMGEDDQSGTALSEMAEQQFAGMLAAGGGLGLAKLVTTGLKQAEVAREKSTSAQP